ncbi:MAG: hypothetical protein AAF928_00825 [Myxococcota bacterium]
MNQPAHQTPPVAYDPAAAPHPAHPYPHQPYPPQAPTMGQPMHPAAYGQPQVGMAPAPVAKRTPAGAVVLLVLAALCLLPALFFGYYAVSNYGAASRLAVDLPEGAEFVVAVVEAKAQRQAMFAGVAGVLTLILGGAGLALRTRKTA